MKIKLFLKKIYSILDSGCLILEKSFTAEDTDLLPRKGRKCTKVCKKWSKKCFMSTLYK